MGKVKNEHKEQRTIESVADIVNGLAQTYVRFPSALFGNGKMFVATASDDYLRNYDIHKNVFATIKLQHRAP